MQTPTVEYRPTRERTCPRCCGTGITVDGSKPLRRICDYPGCKAGAALRRERGIEEAYGDE